MERDFVVRVDGQQRFIFTRKETVLRTEVEAYSYVDNRRKATVFRGAPEDDVALIERLSLYLGLWKRNLVVDEIVHLVPQTPSQQLFLVRVAHSVRNPLWRAGSWVRTKGEGFECCLMKQAQLFTSRRIADNAVRANEKNYNVKFEVVTFVAMIGEGEDGQADEAGTRDSG